MPYVNLDQANAYHAKRMTANAWNALNDQEKNARLLAASDYIDGAYRFKYRKTDPNQLRQFPRAGSWAIPVVVLQAVCELAAIGVNGLSQTTARLKRKTQVGELSVEYETATDNDKRPYPLIDGLLADWVINPNLRHGWIMAGGSCVNHCDNGNPISGTPGGEQSNHPTVSGSTLPQNNDWVEIVDLANNRIGFVDEDGK